MPEHDTMGEKHSNLSSFTGTNKSSMAIQIIIGLIIILILYIISLLVLNTDSLVVYSNAKVKKNEKIYIFQGQQAVTKISGSFYNTINPYTENFLKIPKSVNDRGGAQFSYQFWMKISDTGYANYQNLTVLLKGDKTQYVRGVYDAKTGVLVPFDPILYNQSPDNTSSQPDYMVKCPLIKFGNSYKNLIIEFNTNKDPSARMETILEGSSEYSKNVLSLSPLNWYLITYVIEDNYSPASGTVNGIQVVLYVNDFPYQTSSAATDPLLRNNYLRQNDGDLYMFPDVQVPKEFMQLSNMRYFNYALSQSDVASTFMQGPSLFTPVDTRSTDGKNNPAFLSSYNKIDIYNK